jgi:acyl-coenzyme A thioesterase PaaI-like protein
MAGMSDVTAHSPASVPNRLGVTARLGDEDELVITLHPTEYTTRLGCVRASMLVYVVDVVTGIPADTVPDSWTLTSELSVRTHAVPAPLLVEGRHRMLRDGRRSATAEAWLLDDQGRSMGLGVASFSRVERRPDDGPKYHFQIPESFAIFGSAPPIDEPLQDAVGLRVVDAAAGIVEVEVGALLTNPAGTLQGAIVAYVAEAAAEELLTSLAGEPVLVTELDVRYLGQARLGAIVRSRTRLVAGATEDPLDGTVVVELVDVATDRIVTYAVAKGVIPPGR